MKKTIFALSVLVVITTGAKAQNNTTGSPSSDQKKTDGTKKKITFGPEIGLNMADMMLKASESTQKTSMKAGVAVGGVVDFALNNNYSLQPGLFYLMNGCNIEQNPTPPSGPPGAINLNTIQVPINVLYKFSPPGKNRIFVGIGPYVAYNFSGAAKTSGGPTTTLTIGDKPNAGNIRPLDYGAGINAGYQFASGLLVRVRYQLGFANLNPSPGGTETTSGLGLTVGYLFGGK